MMKEDSAAPNLNFGSKAKSDAAASLLKPSDPAGIKAKMLLKNANAGVVANKSVSKEIDFNVVVVVEDDFDLGLDDDDIFGSTTKITSSDMNKNKNKTDKKSSSIAHGNEANDKKSIDLASETLSYSVHQRHNHHAAESNFDNSPHPADFMMMNDLRDDEESIFNCVAVSKAQHAHDLDADFAAWDVSSPPASKKNKQGIPEEPQLMPSFDGEEMNIDDIDFEDLVKEEKTTSRANPIETSAKREETRTNELKVATPLTSVPIQKASPLPVSPPPPPVVITPALPEQQHKRQQLSTPSIEKTAPASVKKGLSLGGSKPSAPANSTATPSTQKILTASESKKVDWDDWEF
eukprot:GDKJ01059150.1.p1 GENE.GDKJ01059150.1~~GDKJ01059150.1.p1  ORF type:complete len:395 (+),score=136.67 GDKJ01059150.1:139-1185(+)